MSPIVLPKEILERRRERKREQRLRTGPSPERRAERHVAGPDAIDVMLHAGGVTRDSRFRSSR